MKLSSILVIALSCAIVGFVSGANHALHFTVDGGNATVVLAVRDHLNVTFEGMPSTGYWWWLMDDESSECLNRTAQLPAVSSTPPNNYQFEFDVLEAGCTGTWLRFGYLRPWVRVPPTAMANVKVFVSRGESESEHE
eukprot:CAMPEP_0196771548 /NCGR_PEP_ID=MMETSP1104-20130614/1745_1 /TAXON_ID=33652 /ORGANISM="Cafeteria sp., Strain Caron Lab Isolate" /LENGTH=136 /DNA_ID=CAMNT_0042141669 /DNA_START=65 /DNA_END=475 /DNA_ORIENTATION=-